MIPIVQVVINWIHHKIMLAMISPSVLIKRSVRAADSCGCIINKCQRQHEDMVQYVKYAQLSLERFDRIRMKKKASALNLSYVADVEFGLPILSSQWPKKSLLWSQVPWGITDSLSHSESNLSFVNSDQEFSITTGKLPLLRPLNSLSVSS